MFFVALVFILSGALISAVTGFRALGPYLRFRHARAAEGRDALVATGVMPGGVWL